MQVSGRLSRSAGRQPTSAVCAGCWRLGAISPVSRTWLVLAPYAEQNRSLGVVTRHVPGGRRRARVVLLEWFGGPGSTRSLARIGHGGVGGGRAGKGPGGEADPEEREWVSMHAGLVVYTDADSARITTVSLYSQGHGGASQYGGPLPHGLNFSMGQAEVQASFPRPPDFTSDE